MFTRFALSLAMLIAAGTAIAAEFPAADASVADPLAGVRLPNRATRQDLHLGFPRATTLLKSVGEVRIKTIFVDFSDAIATRTPESVFGLISPGANDFWRAVSYGRMNATFDPAFQWLRLSRRSDQYSWSKLTASAHRAYIQEAVDRAIAAGVDFSSSDTVAVMANPDAAALHNGPTYVAGGIKAGNKTFAVAITSGRDLLHWGYKWVNHEGGHMMGLPDLYPFAGKGQRYVGDYSMMGLISGTAPEYFGWERWLLGWLDDDQVIRAKRGTTTLILTPLETRGGRKIVVIPTGATTAVVVENRQPLGLDRQLFKAGPLAYLVDTAIDSGRGPLRVLPLDENDGRKLNAPLSEGQILTHHGASVKFVAGEAGNVTLEIVRP